MNEDFELWFKGYKAGADRQGESVSRAEGRRVYWAQQEKEFRKRMLDSSGQFGNPVESQQEYLGK